MSKKTVTEIIEIVDHPLEDFFGIEPNTTEIVKYEQKTELVKAEEYDDKDNEVEENFQEIYDKALSGYENLQESIEDIDPRYAARSHEVANQLLTTALHAAEKKAKLKEHKDKIALIKNKTGPKTVNNNIFTDTNTLIQQLKKAANQSAPIEVIATVIEGNNEQSNEETK